MSIIPIIVKRRNIIVKKFSEAQAVDTESAKALEDLALETNSDISFLLKKGTLVKTEDGRYYLNEQKKFFS